MYLLETLRFTVDCVNKVTLGDIVKAASLPDKLSGAAENLRHKKDLIVEGVLEGKKLGTLVLYLADAHGSMGGDPIPVVFDGGWLIEQSRGPREKQNYRAPNGVFGVLPGVVI